MKLNKSDIKEQLTTRAQASLAEKYQLMKENSLIESDCGDKPQKVKEKECDCDDCECNELEEAEMVDVFYDENDSPYLIELNEDTLTERRIHIRITSKGQRLKKIRCPKGKVVKTVGGKRVCATPSGRERLRKKIAIRKTVRQKRARGSGYQTRITRKRGRALRKRKAMGLKNLGTSRNM